MSGLLKTIGEAFVDPGSGQGSMSRLGIGVLVTSFGGFMALCAEGRLSLEAMKIIADVFKWAFPSVALVYGVNSANNGLAAKSSARM